MKRRLCFRITAKLGNSKRQHYSWQEKKIYIYILAEGPLFEKIREEKEEGKTKRTGKSFYLHMNCRNASYAQGTKC